MFILVNAFAMLAVNGIQIGVVLYLKRHIDYYKKFQDTFNPKDNNLTSSLGSAKQFFNPQVLANLGKTESRCDRKSAEAIVKKYESKYKGKDMPYEIGKAILKEVNENNDANRLMDLNGQIIKHARYIVEEQINKMEK